MGEQHIGQQVSTIQEAIRQTVEAHYEGVYRVVSVQSDCTTEYTAIGRDIASPAVEYVPLKWEAEFRVKVVDARTYGAYKQIECLVRVFPDGRIDIEEEVITRRGR